MEHCAVELFIDMLPSCDTVPLVRGDKELVEHCAVESFMDMLPSCDTVLFRRRPGFLPAARGNVSGLCPFWPVVERLSGAWSFCRQERLGSWLSEAG